MKQTYDEAIAQVYRDEGGYTNDPRDPGGPTNFGITLADAKSYWKSTATAEDVRTMPQSVAASIYEKHYAIPLHYDDLPPGVDYAVLDYGINSGVGRAAHVYATVKQTITNPVDIINAIYDERLSFLRSLSTWDHFGRGWTNRCNNGRTFALNLNKKYAKVDLTKHATTAAVTGTAMGTAYVAAAHPHLIPIAIGLGVVAVMVWAGFEYARKGKI
jgi:lysozyme family protein